MRNSILHYGHKAGSARFRQARKMDTYIASLMAEFPKTLERRDTSIIMYYTYLLLFMQCYILDHSTCSISSHGDYSRAASISFRVCSGVATIREWRLFESGVYSRAASIRSYTVIIFLTRPMQQFKHNNFVDPRPCTPEANTIRCVNALFCPHNKS